MIRCPHPLRLWALALFVALLSGCFTLDDKRRAITNVSEVYRQEYEKILEQKGTRLYKVQRNQAFNALRIAMTQLAMRIDTQSPDIGYLSVYAPAPLPLSRAEWQEVADKELPRLHELLMKDIGLLGYFQGFEPEGLEIVISAAALEVRAGTQISLTMRMREVAPPPSGMPRREYAPPTAVSMGLDKIWKEVDAEIGGKRSF